MWSFLLFTFKFTFVLQLAWKERRAEVVLSASLAAVLPHEHMSLLSLGFFSPLCLAVAEEEEEKCRLFSSLEKQGFPLLA